MLLLPALRKIGTLTVFSDDELWYRFYLVPEAPTVRLDESGKPVFLLVKYAFGDEARAVDPSLPAGGGYMNFDVVFSPSAGEEMDARRELQKWVDAEYVRRKADPVFSGKPEYQAAKAPEVLFAAPTWSKGHVRMSAPQSSTLVTGRVAEQPASLVSSNVAVFNLDLSPSGATFMQKTLVGEDGRGATDLTPIQVVYELAFWGRLPPVSIHIEADSQRVYAALSEVQEKVGDDPCTPDVVESYRKTGTSSSSLAETGAITVRIDKGDASLSEEALEALRKFAFDLFDDLLKEKFLVPVEEETAPEVEEPDTPLERDDEPAWSAVLYEHANYGGSSQTITGDVANLAESGMNDKISSLKVRKGVRIVAYRHANFQGPSATYTGDAAVVGEDRNDSFSSIRVYRSSQRKVRLVRKEHTSTMSTKVVLDLTQSRVVEWPLAPQSTLETFFKGKRPSEIAEHVREIDLGDPFFQSLGLEVRAFAPFDKEPVSFVDVDVEYRGRNEDGAELVKTQTFTFTRSGEPQRWNPSLLGKNRGYRYRYRVSYTGRDKPSAFSPWLTDDQPSLNVAVADPGKLDVTIFSANLNFDVVATVSARITYVDPDAPDEPVDQTLVLDKATRSSSFVKYLYRPVVGPVRVVPTFFLTNGQRIDGEAIETRATQVPIQMPFVDMLNVSVAPAGDFTDVVQVVVSLSYDDGAGFHEDKDIRFTAPDQLVSWNVLLRRPESRRFRQKALILYKNAAPFTQDWRELEGDQAIAVTVPSQPKLKVDIFASLVDFKVTPVVAVTVTHHGRRETTQTFSFTTPEKATFVVPLAEGESARATYSVKYMPQGEPPVELPPVELPAVGANAAQVYLAPYKSQKPEAGRLKVTAVGNLVEFDKTPLVQVDLFYRDPEGGVDEIGSLLLQKTAPLAIWDIATKDFKKRAYRYKVTYHFADGSPSVELPELATEIPQIILKAYKPA